MTFKPAHKVACDEHKPGQLRNETRLAEYIARKSDDFNYFPLAQDVDKKLSQALSNTPHAREHAKEAASNFAFNRWFEERTQNFDEGEKITWEDFELVARQAWKTAQEIQNGR